MINNTISREVAEQSKGFRLQKLRAIKLVLDEMEKENVSVYAAVEYLDDLYLKTVSGNEISEYVEGDKNYESVTSFTFSSEEVKNTLVGFLDCWIRNAFSTSLRFGFYTNVAIGKEKQTANLTLQGITLPNDPIIQLLIDRKYHDDHDLMIIVKTLLIKEYKEQYTKHKKDGNIAAIIKLDQVLWCEFFDKIKWQFGEEDDQKLEESLIQRIKYSKIYDSVNIIGKEKYILSALESLFDKKQKEKDVLAKLIGNSDVKILFLEIANGVYKRPDPVYEIWETMNPPTDKRNVREKILEVCAMYCEKELGRIDRKVTSARIELARIDKRERGSFQYRIYEECEAQIDELVKQHNENVDETLIKNWLEELFIAAKNHLEDKSNDYSYPFSSRDTIKNVILELFDSCYLAFNKKE